ncbi:MAG: hypothetical protein ACLRZ9_12405 [Eubacterium sp.]
MEVKNNIRCKNCGADMIFDPQTGKMLCKSCGSKQWIGFKDYREELRPISERNVDEIKDKAVHHDWMLEGDTAICKNCGGEVSFSISDNTVVCPYCGSNLVVKDLERKTLSPDGVIPFKLSEKDARKAFNKWVNNKFLCPKVVKRIVKKEKFQGIYLPCWTFDVQTHIACTGTYMDKKNKVHFSDAGKKFINDRIVIATDKYEVEHIREVYPYKTERNRPYRDEYVAGFVSEKYTVAIEKSWRDERPLMEEDIKKKAIKEIKLKYATFKNVTVNEITVTFGEPKYKYLLIPVWLSEFEYKGETYEFVINGETGKAAGELPVSNRKRNIAIILAILAVLFVFRYAKVLFAIAFVIILVLCVCTGALIWYIKKKARNQIRD